MKASKADRVERKAERRILAAVTTRPGLEPGQLGRWLGWPRSRVEEVLRRLAAAGSLGSQRSRQYPTGPLVDTWYPAAARSAS